MALTVEDLKPQDFTVTIKGVTLTCRPVRLSQALIIAKLGNVFTDPKSSTTTEIKQAEADLDDLVQSLIPELTGVQLDMGAVMELLAQLMDSIQPDDNKELKEKGVKFDSDPKAPTIG